MSEEKANRLDLFGKDFGRYHVGQKLGEGGYAIVYRANEPEIDREVALKILKPNSRGEYAETVRKRFMREARLVAGLKDHHTIQLYDYGEEDGLLFLAFEYVEGETLGERLEREGALKPLIVVKVIEQLLEAVEEAHDRGVLHRDIKPGNIMVYDHGRRGLQVKVLDFGIGKFVRDQQKITQLTAEGRMIGTPRYMSPEQMKGDDNLTPACDLWAVGMVAYEALTGKRAIRTDDLMAVTSRILDSSTFELPADLGVPAFLREMVAKLLRKDVERRYQSASEVLRDLEDFKMMATSEHRVDELEEKLQREVEEEAASMPEEMVPVAPVTPGTVEALPTAIAAKKDEEEKPEAQKKTKGDMKGFGRKAAMVAAGVVVCVGLVLAVFSDDEPNGEVPAFLLEQDSGAAATKVEADEEENLPLVLEQGDGKSAKAEVKPSPKVTKEVEKAPAARAKKRPVEKVEDVEKVEAVEKKPVVAEAKKGKAEAKPSRDDKKREEPLEEAEKKPAVAEATPGDEDATSPATKQETEEASKVEKEKDPEKTKLRIWGVE